jgi:ABC-type Mn2+/Zn2+ transport system ATPase subunit
MVHDSSILGDMAAAPGNMAEPADSSSAEDVAAPTDSLSPKNLRTPADVRPAEDVAAPTDVRPAGSPLLSAKNLSIGYRWAEPVVRNIHIDLEEQTQMRTIIGFVGPNGAGKTTFLKTCLGLLAPLDGELRLLGVDTRSASFVQIRRKLAYIPQNRPEGNSGQLRVSVREAVSFGRLGKLGLTGRFGRLDREAVEAAIAYCGLEGLADKAVQDLSGGQFQRVSIARAMAAEPALYLFDEPGSYLDEEGQEAMRTLIHSIAKSGVPLILVTHDRRLVKLCDAVIAFRKGTAQLLDTSVFLAETRGREI